MNNSNTAPDIAEVEIISDKVQEELLDKYDSESATRKLTGIFAIIVKWFCIIMSCYHIYTAIFGMMESLRHRAMHLAFVLPLCFVLYPVSRKHKTNIPSVWDCFLALASMTCCGYVVVFFGDIVAHGGIPTQTDIVLGVITIVLVLLGVRRVVGWQLTTIAVVFLLYAYFGQYMPGVLAHKGFSIKRMIDHLYMLPEGVFSAKGWRWLRQSVATP